jgi:hypothetical protein
MRNLFRLISSSRQQQQLERVKKWLQLRNRDTDHRSQVEERRKKRDEEAKVLDSKPCSITVSMVLHCCICQGKDRRIDTSRERT